jgi:hypothetical protein
MYQRALVSPLASDPSPQPLFRYGPTLPFLPARSLVIGSKNATVRKDCFGCVQNDPYNGTASNYNW